MSHLSVVEWGPIDIGEKGFSRLQADHLLAAARAHPLGGRGGTAILTDHHRWLFAQQMVGVIAGPDCSLEILPKIDPSADAKKPGRTGIRQRLIQMLDIALGLDIGIGSEAAMARQNETLLDILIRVFADRLANQVRRGLPRQYVQCEEDLPTLRGRLDVTRQFTALAVRADRLACRFDILSYDTALLQVMKACVVALIRHARLTDTLRRLSELRIALADVADVPPRDLPWHAIAIDRTNRHWRSLVVLARLFLRREWQSTHRSADPNGSLGLTLLFPMNDLFETYIAALLRRALAPLGFDIVTQGGGRCCLEELRDDGSSIRLFRTKPDVMICKDNRALLIIDTKWKRLAPASESPKRDVEQSDIYQMMAYARIYRCSRLMLLYPFHSALEGQGRLARHRFNVEGVDEHLTFASVNLADGPNCTIASLRDLVYEAIQAGTATSRPSEAPAY